MLFVEFAGIQDSKFTVASPLPPTPGEVFGGFLEDSVETWQLRLSGGGQGGLQGGLGGPQGGGQGEPRYQGGPRAREGPGLQFCNMLVLGQ